MSDNIRRSGTVGCVGRLSMAELLASMFTAIIKTTTSVWTLEGSGPFFDSVGSICCNVTLSTVLRLLAITAQKVLLDLAAVAACRYADLTSSAWPFMAGSRAAMLSASHQLAADLTTAPAVFVVCVYAASSDRLATTKAVLGRAHQ